MFWTTNADYRLATATADGEDLTAILGGEGSSGVDSGPVPELFTSISSSPDGERLAFAASVEDEPTGPDLGGDVFTAAPDGSDVQQLTDLGDVSSPVWSPDGGRIVFSRTRTGPKVRGLAAALFSVDADGENLRQLTEFEGRQLDRPGSFSPDGRRLAFSRALVSSSRRFGLVFDPEIKLLDISSMAVTDLIDDALDPAYSPDGEQLVFASVRDRNGRLTYGESTKIAAELYVSRSDGSQPRRLTTTRALNESSPVWSSDGERIAFQRGKEIDNAEAMSVRQINPDGSCDSLILGDRPRGSWYASPTWIDLARERGLGAVNC